MKFNVLKIILSNGLYKSTYEPHQHFYYMCIYDKFIDTDVKDHTLLIVYCPHYPFTLYS